LTCLTCVSYHDMGKIYYRLGKFPEAKKWYKKALDIRTKALGENHVDVAQNIHSLAYLYTTIGTPILTFFSL
jgi:tetratricopeptide (TPR) repeat protein